MQEQITMKGKSISVEITPKAEKALAQRSTPLLVEMQLYFSCLVVKNVAFRDEQTAKKLARVSEQLSISFRPMMRAACEIGSGKEFSRTDMDIPRVENFIPRWLRIDRKSNKWVGEFGY